MSTFDVRACKPGETPAKEDQLGLEIGRDGRRRLAR